MECIIHGFEVKEDVGCFCGNLANNSDERDIDPMDASSLATQTEVDCILHPK